MTVRSDEGALAIACLLVLAGCAGQVPPGGGLTTHPTATTADGPMGIDTATTARATTGRPGPTGPGDCVLDREALQWAWQTWRSPDERTSLPSPPTNLTNASLRRVAVEYEVTVVTREFRNRTDVVHFGIGPATTDTAAVVTNRSATGACVAVRVPYHFELDGGSVADVSSVAVYFVNRTTIRRARCGRVACP